MRAVKSVSIDSERRVIITFLDGSTETLYPNCIWCDSEALRQLIKDLLEEKADAVVQTINDVAIATFSDGADEALIRKLLVSIEPIQEGTGDPSPENIRPFTGRTGLTVYRSGNDTSNPVVFPVSWESEVGLVYGGTLDVVNGKLIADKALYRVTRFTGAWGETNNGYGVYTSINGSVHSPLPGSFGKPVSNMFVYSSGGYVTMPLYSFCGASGIASTYTFILDTSITSLEEANAWLSNLTEGLYVTYYLATPTETQLTPQEITTLLGDNNIWADSGNILELEYVADTKLYIGESQSGTLGSGRQTISNTDLQPVSEKTWEDVSEAYKAETVGEKTHEESNDERGE